MPNKNIPEKTTQSKNQIPKQKNSSPVEVVQPVEQQTTVPQTSKETVPIETGTNPAPETAVEIQPEREREKKHKKEKDNSLDNKIDALKKKLKLKKKSQVKMPQIKDDLTLKIEKVMEDGLGDVFQELTTIQKQEFKIKGEETAWKIRQLLKKTHIKIKEIFKLLMEWLKMLPGINKFFLEQEAKIKADKILSMKDFYQKK